MGLLRFLLAMGVVLHHIPNGVSLMNGGIAVEVFFMISGFYMAIILENKYASKTLLFYSNRLLRLAPAYFLMLAAQVALVIFTRQQEPIELILSSENNTLSASIILANIFVLGQEAFSFITITPGLGASWDPSQTLPGKIGRAHV